MYRDRAGRVEAEARPSKLASATRVEVSMRSKPSEAEDSFFAEIGAAAAP